MSLPAPGSVRAVAFDLDGTLVDTLPGLAAAGNAMLGELGLPAATPARVRGFVGDGIGALVRRLLTGVPDGQPDPVLGQRALASFERHYQATYLQDPQCYAGAHALLQALRAQGLRLAVVTNKAGAFTRPLLDRVGLTPLLDRVLSGDDLPRRKPDPDPLLACCAGFGVTPAQLLMVGDSRNDVLCARAAGVPVACVSFGYCSEPEGVRALEPDAIVDALVQVHDLVGCPPQP